MKEYIIYDKPVSEIKNIYKFDDKVKLGKKLAKIALNYLNRKKENNET